MPGTLNFYKNIGLESEELKTLDLNSREGLSKLLEHIGTTSGSSSSSIGILIKDISEDKLKVRVGPLVGGFNTLDTVQSGYGVFNASLYGEPLSVSFDVENKLSDLSRLVLFSSVVSNYEIPGIGSIPDTTVKYAGFKPVFDPREEGTATISSTNNQVSLVNGDFTEKLRGQSTGSSSRIRFFQSDGTPANNNGIYEVIDVVDANNIIISGDLVDESDLSYVVVGTFDLLNQVAANLVTKAVYFKLVGEFSVQDNISDFITAGGFPVAKITFNAPPTNTFTVEDIREDYLFSIGKSKISELYDVDLTGLVDGDLLKYDNTSEKFIPTDLSWTDITSLFTFSSTYFNNQQIEWRLLSDGSYQIRGKVQLKAAAINTRVLMAATDSSVDISIAPKITYAAIDGDQSYAGSNKGYDQKLQVAIAENEGGPGISMGFLFPNETAETTKYYYFNVTLTLKL